MVFLVHHHPAHIGEDGYIILIDAGGAHIDDTGLAVGVLFPADDF